MPERPRPTTPSCPLPREQVIDRYFLEHRQKLLDIAAFLDRVDRAAGAPAPAPADHRIDALLSATRILNDGQPHRARRILEALSDPTRTPAPSGRKLAPATGAPPHSSVHRDPRSP